MVLLNKLSADIKEIKSDVKIIKDNVACINANVLAIMSHLGIPGPHQEIIEPHAVTDLNKLTELSREFYIQDPIKTLRYLYDKPDIVDTLLLVRNAVIEHFGEEYLSSIIELEMTADYEYPDWKTVCIKIITLEKDNFESSLNKFDNFFCLQIRSFLFLTDGTLQFQS